MTLPALVSELRAVVVDATDATASADRRRRAAARELARLAAAGVPGADPQDWYGLLDLSDDGPLRGPEQSVRVSPSRVESFQRCSLRWLLEGAGGRKASGLSTNLGNLVHELAQEVPDGDLQRLTDLLERRFPRLGLGPGWAADKERERAKEMIRKLAEYVARATKEGRELVAVEQPVQVQIGRAVVSGTVDRLERDDQGRLVVVDLKTGRSKPAKAELPRHAQLGVYQLAVEEGGFGEGEASGGARLAQLGDSTKTVSVQDQAPLADDEDPQWARRLVETVAEQMSSGTFPATVNPMCRMCDLKRSCPAQPEGRQVVE